MKRQTKQEQSDSWRWHLALLLSIVANKEPFNNDGKKKRKFKQTKKGDGYNLGDEGGGGKI